MKQIISNYLKNIPGWRTKRKLLCFAVDDYGNIRLSGKTARQNLLDVNAPLQSRFDTFDALDTREDFEHLYHVLKSVKDKNDHSAVFTTYALPCNTNYSETHKKGSYVPQNLNEAYTKLAVKNPEAYDGAYKLLMSGIKQNLICPQFHGREHINVALFNTSLQEKNPVLMKNLEMESLAGIPAHINHPNVKYSEAFAFWDASEIEAHKLIIADGIKRFEDVYGYKPKTFTPPAMQLHPDLYEFVEKQGIIAIDKPRTEFRHLGMGNYKKENNVLGVQKGQKHVTIVRNCMFEPNSKEIDWVNYTFNQIKAAFFWNKPAIISSHRVNFAGHIDPANRKKGLSALESLLKKIVKTWPDVEFIAIDDLATEILNSKK